MMFLAQCPLHGNHSVNKSSYLFSLLVGRHFAFQVRMKIGVANSFFKGELDQPSTFAKNVFYLVCSIRKECLCPGASSNVNTVALLLRLRLNDSAPSWTRARGILNADVPYLYSRKMPFWENRPFGTLSSLHSAFINSYPYQQFDFCKYISEPSFNGCGLV